MATTRIRHLESVTRWMLLVLTLSFACASPQFTKTVKGGYGGGHQYRAGDNLIRYYNGTQSGLSRVNNTLQGNLDKGVCYTEVPTINLAKDRNHVPAGNGSRPDLSRIRVCCEGYEANIHNPRLCEPVCTTECVNALCTAPNTCSCYPDHVKNLAGFCVSTCPIGCQNGHCVGGECMCKEGYRLDSESRFCVPFCHNNCGGLGNCTAPNTCECGRGYKSGPNGICQPACDRCNGGLCVAPNDCRCPSGYLKNARGDCEPQCNRDCKPGLCIAPNLCSNSQILPTTTRVPGVHHQGPTDVNQNTQNPDLPTTTLSPFHPNQPRPYSPGNQPYYPGSQPVYYPGNQPSNYPGMHAPSYPGQQSIYPDQQIYIYPGEQPQPNPSYRPYNPNQSPPNYPGYQPNYPGNQHYYPGSQPYKPLNQSGILPNNSTKPSNHSNNPSPLYPDQQIHIYPGEQPQPYPGYRPYNPYQSPPNYPGQQPNYPGNQHYYPGSQPFKPTNQSSLLPNNSTKPSNPFSNPSPHFPVQLPGYPGQQPIYRPGDQRPYYPNPYYPESQPTYYPGQPLYDPGFSPGQRPINYPDQSPNGQHSSYPIYTDSVINNQPAPHSDSQHKPYPNQHQPSSNQTNTPSNQPLYPNNQYYPGNQNYPFDTNGPRDNYPSNQNFNPYGEYNPQYSRVNNPNLPTWPNESTSNAGEAANNNLHNSDVEVLTKARPNYATKGGVKRVGRSVENRKEKMPLNIASLLLTYEIPDEYVNLS